ncbi:hypothetical protein D3C77_726080 [compost metagenome]
MVALQGDEDAARARRQEQLVAVGTPHIQVQVQRRIAGLGNLSGAAQGAIGRVHQQVENQALSAGRFGADNIGQWEQSYHGCLY